MTETRIGRERTKGDDGREAYGMKWENVKGGDEEESSTHSLLPTNTANGCSGSPVLWLVIR